MSKIVCQKCLQRPAVVLRIVDGAPMTLCEACAREHAPICDFCSNERPTWIYPATDITPLELEERELGALAEMSGGWIACDACHDLIRHDRWDNLADRSVQTMRAISMLPRTLRPAARRVMRAKIEVLHELFRVHRTGSARPWG